MLTLTFALSCAESRDRPLVDPLTTWSDDVAAVVRTRCATAGCHAGIAPSSGYDLTSYQGALGPGTDDTANAIAGDAQSQILLRLDIDTHASLFDVIPLLRRWVVDSKLAYRRDGLHEPGVLDPQSAEFHGRVLEQVGWKFSECQRCHGEDFAGRATVPSCLSCHPQGPTACVTCHGADGPTTDAHPRHAAVGHGCGSCHPVPATWDEAGHLLDAQGDALPRDVRVTLGALANRDLTPPRRTMPASYDPSTGTCSAVYCHGGVLGDPAATLTAPTWTTGATAAACGTCHGQPPASHAQAECRVCHPRTVTSAGGLTTAHLDAVVDVGDGVGACTGCHGAGAQLAPPGGLHGEQLVTDVAVGAHRAHLEAFRLRGPIACDECHRVPTTVGEAGHLDSALPAELVFGALATADGAAPSWNRAAATCATVYCHGGGTGLAAEPSAGKHATPRWTATTAETVYCGACHGLPPSDPFHAPTLQLTDCATCHGRSIGGFGDILFTGPPGARTSTHINGLVDFL